MFNLIKRIGSQVLANTLVIGTEQYIRSTVESIVRERRLAKQAKRDQEQHSRR